jgi:hypothetical protein
VSALDSIQAVVARDTLRTSSPELVAVRDSLAAVVSDPEGAGLLRIKTMGTCLRPLATGGYSDRVDGGAGVKLLYFRRYGVGVGCVSRTAGVFVSRRLDDVVPFARNTEAMVLYGTPLRHDAGRLYVGLGVGL